MDYKKISKGTPAGKMPSFNAEWQNNVSEAAQYFHDRIKNGQSSGNATGLKRPLLEVKAKNTETTAFSRGHCVQLGDYKLTTIDFRHPVFDGEEYDGGSRWGIAMGPIPPAAKGGFWPVQMMGVALALVNVTDTDHEYAEPESGERVFQSGDSGPLQILNNLSTTGEQECFVLLGGGGSTEPNYIAKITGTFGARIGGTLGYMSNVELGVLNDFGTWNSALTGQEVFSPSLSEVHVPSGQYLLIPVSSVGGKWVLNNATDLRQVEGWNTANDQSIGHDAADNDVKWQDDGDCS